VKLKILYIEPHLSTGGAPQFALKRIQSLQKFKNEIEIFLVEYSNFSETYVVQRNEIIKLLGEEHFFTLGGTGEIERKYGLIDIIKNNKIDVIHSEEMLDGFEAFNRIPLDLLNQIYSNDRSWRIVETCHNIWYDPKTNKKLQPEAYSLVTPYHMDNTFKSTKPMKRLSLYPFENKVNSLLEEYGTIKGVNTVPLIHKLKIRDELGLDLMKTHVLNVGLWTSGKNQGEGVEVARTLVESNPNIQFHFIGNQAPNFEGYWGSIMKDLPSNVKVWGERSDVDKFMQACDVFMFNSTWECNPLVVRESVNYGMKILTRNLPQYSGMFDNYVTPIEGDVENISKQLLYLIESDDSYEIPMDDSFGQGLLDLYKEVSVLDITQQDPIENDYVIKQHFVVNPFFEILGQGGREFNIKLFDDKSLVYENNIKINSWVKLNREYYTKWKTEVRENNNLIYENVLDLEDKRVYISFGSKSLGDTLAWIPYCEEFRLKHNCELIVSTFMNSLFKDEYPNIEFVDPGETVYNIITQYQLGWYYNENGEFDFNKHPFDFKRQPLQKTATDILGLEYKEIRPKLKLPNVSKKKKVGIGFHSTAQAKYWNNPDGWQSVIDHLDALGYECMIYSKEGDGYMNNFYPKGVTLFKGGNLQEVINDLSTCEFFIGLGSGLSWLAWACELPVILISGFSEKYAETKLDTYRVINEDVCHGCFNNDRLNASDWNWCPLHKGTDRQFECSKKITSDMVIKEINKIMNEEQVIEKKNKLDGFDWGGKTNWYSESAIKEIEDHNIYDRCFTVEEGDIVVDLGASLGPFTYSILPNNPKQCFVVEPLSYQIEVLKKNVGKDNVKIIQGAITDKKRIDITWDGISESVPTFTFREFLNENGIDKIDFLKCDCEGGEYDVFSKSNIEFLKTIPKIVTEFHLRDDENFHQCKFRWFRDNILQMFENFEVYSIDGVNIKWDLWNEHFIEYYNEVIIYIDNR
jgi:autotransporter strand-loop-strand O-heptosyltransferase